MFDPSVAPSPSVAPAPPPAPSPVVAVSSNPRYGYLVRRLRERQITMEEATELFAIFQAVLAAPASPAPPPPPQAAVRPRAVATGPIAVTDDTLAIGLLALGVGAGLLAALGARARGERPPRRPSATGRQAAPV